MAHDVFICHSSEDKTLANAACAKLEAAGIRCWIAPRDPLPGIPYGRQLVSAIETSGIILLIFSGNANRSEHILRELELASDRGKIVVPYRIEDVKPTGDLEYYIRNVHWLDAMTEPVEARLDELVTLIRKVLETVPGHQLADTVAVPAAVAAVASAPPPAKSAAGRTGLLAGVAALVVALAAGAFAFVSMNSHKEAAAPLAAPTKAAVAAQAPKPAAPKPVAAPTARIIYVEKPAAAAPAAAAPAVAAHVAAAPAAIPAAKPATHPVEPAKPAAAAAAVAAVAEPPAPPAAASDFDSDLHRLVQSASNHFAEAKGTPRKLRGEQEYAYSGSVAGLDNCYIHQNAGGVLTATSCRVYLGPDSDAAQVAYKKYSAMLASFASTSGGKANERTRPDGGLVTAYNSGEARLRLLFLTNDKAANAATVFLWADAPP